MVDLCDLAMAQRLAGKSGGGGGGGAVPFSPIIYTTGLNAAVVNVTTVDEEGEE